MRHSLRSHILHLEERVQSLRDRLTASHLAEDEIQDIEQKLALAELALARYREAFALELSISSPGTPDSPGTATGEGAGSPEAVNSDKHRQGRGGSVSRRSRARFRAVSGRFVSRTLKSFPRP